MSTQGETKAARKPLLSPSTRENLRIYKYKFSRNKLSVFGLVLVLLSFFFAIFAEVIVPHPESIGSFVDYANASLPPCKDYLFGTDQMGRFFASYLQFPRCTDYEYRCSGYFCSGRNGTWTFGRILSWN